jgi:hypothetical protein
MHTTLQPKPPSDPNRKRKKGMTRESEEPLLDRALVKIVAFKEKHKLTDKWEQEPYKVLGQPNPDIPVFTVQREDGEGRKRNLHKNLLLPVGDIRETPVKPVPKPRVRTL